MHEFLLQSSPTSADHLLKISELVCMTSCDRRSHVKPLQIAVSRPLPACQIDYRLKLLFEHISITKKKFNFTQQCAIAQNNKVRSCVPGHADTMDNIICVRGQETVPYTEQSTEFTEAYPCNAKINQDGSWLLVEMFGY